MQTREVLRRLRRLSLALNRECHHINRGGCAVMAAMVGRHLQRLGVPCDVVTPHWRRSAPWEASIRNNVKRRNDVQTWIRNGLNNQHLAVRFKLDGELFIWDSEGVVRGGRKFCRCVYTGEPEYECWSPFGKGLQVRECGAIAGVPSAWNSLFDRAQIPTMQRLVAQFL